MPRAHLCDEQLDPPLNEDQKQPLALLMRQRMEVVAFRGERAVAVVGHLPWTRIEQSQTASSAPQDWFFCEAVGSQPLACAGLVLAGARGAGPAVLLGAQLAAAAREHADQPVLQLPVRQHDVHPAGAACQLAGGHRPELQGREGGAHVLSAPRSACSATR